MDRSLAGRRPVACTKETKKDIVYVCVPLVKHALEVTPIAFVKMGCWVI